jgi:GNAT superfamily N-acetyltransferase
MGPRKRRFLTARVTHLEMTEHVAARAPMPSSLRLAIMRATGMPVHFYRYIYEQVGRPHHWTLRRDMSDAALSAEINADSTEIHILYADGSPAGFAEMDLKRLPAVAEIVYFGLIPECQGRGLGRFFLGEMIHAAWSYNPGRVTINTNTLDSPRALPLYQKMGFRPCSWSQEQIEAWD